MLPNESVVTKVQDYVRIMVLINEFIYELEQREALDEEDAEFVDDDLLHLTLISGRLPDHDLKVRIISLQFNWALQDNEVSKSSLVAFYWFSSIFSYVLG